ncbi:(2Fe-2S)-binding protein [Novosphingobium naphthalenivorans]|uniref:(2Fe-2S)-binding protein n=1 Tax=Novosphingobium naphthalenivorans TaxID=273168 RepID=UPI00083078A6|nr:(2Fe-2S)-binding protein [Novosphingobium naphthalenivorans]
MAERQSIELHINEETHVVSPDTGNTLLQVLRSTLSLTGTKRGCNQGVCGACTVLRNGVPARSCLTLAVECDDEEITTIEGLAPNGKASIVQQAFVKVGAPQCGFCMPGMVLVATALLREHSNPDQAEIREALSGNLCRCTGYVKIAEAIELAAEQLV